MKKPGGLILGIGGDTSPGGVGTFYEGVVAKGYTSAEADDALQANIVAARYGKKLSLAARPGTLKGNQFIRRLKS
jgi:hypothetical protein